MAKKLTLKQLYLGQLIVRNEQPDAQVYTIGAIGHPQAPCAVLLVWFEGSHKCNGWADYSPSYLPSLKQIESSITNGRLASGQDIKDLDLV